MTHGLHRQDQPFQLLSGPPWIHSSSGRGAVAEAPSGSTSQARSGVPSAAVAVTSVSVPGSAARGAGCGSSRVLAGAVGSSRTGAGGASTAARSA